MAHSCAKPRPSAGSGNVWHSCFSGHRVLGWLYGDINISNYGWSAVGRRALHRMRGCGGRRRDSAERYIVRSSNPSLRGKALRCSLGGTSRSISCSSCESVERCRVPQVRVPHRVSKSSLRTLAVSDEQRGGRRHGARGRGRESASRRQGRYREEEATERSKAPKASRNQGSQAQGWGYQTCSPLQAEGATWRSRWRRKGCCWRRPGINRRDETG